MICSVIIINSIKKRLKITYIAFYFLQTLSNSKIVFHTIIVNIVVVATIDLNKETNCSFLENLSLLRNLIIFTKHWRLSNVIDLSLNFINNSYCILFKKRRERQKICNLLNIFYITIDIIFFCLFTAFYCNCCLILYWKIAECFKFSICK